MPAAAERPVLIIDDDGTFRNLVSTLLQARGYDVVEARNHRDAVTVFQASEPSMAIVDYRLPDGDGMSWITWLRNNGSKIPVVFCSGSWCDEKNFNWLRNILRVSLILQKPIMPELFLQQIESILPPSPDALKRLADAAMFASLSEDDEDEPEEQVSTSALLDRELDEINAQIETGPHDAQTMEELRTRLQKLEIRIKLEDAKQTYLTALVDEWRELSAQVREAQHETDGRALANAIGDAHRIKGTSGSVGLHKVSRAAEKVESLLQRMDASDTMAEILWNEIIRALAQGETSIQKRLAVREPKASELIQKTFSGELLYLGPTSELEEVAAAIKSNSGMEVTACDGTVSAFNRAKVKQFNAFLLDGTVSGVSSTLGLPAALRSMSGTVTPTTFIFDQDTEVSAGSLLYAGASSVLTKPISVDELAEALKKLAGEQEDQKWKVLTVDDDEVLTNFISNILTARGLAVKTLNRPINILEAMDSFKPNIVLLDVIMPGLSGYDVCRLLKASDDYKNVPVIFLTSKSDAEGRASAFQAGGNDFLSKPVIADEVIARVLAHLNLSGKTGPKHQNVQNESPILSRAQFGDRFGSAVVDCKIAGLPLSLCLLSIDDFVNISISHGMYLADQVIGSLTDLISCHFRVDDLRSNFGDGGFVLVFPGERREVVSEALGMMLDEFCGLKFNSQGSALRPTFSAGVADTIGDGTTVEQLINAANQRLIHGRRERSGSIPFLS